MTKIFIKQKEISKIESDPNKYINIVTCTYPRPNRLKFLFHLKSLLVNQNNIRWFVVDDNDHLEDELANFLPNFATHLFFGPTKDKGNAQRNYAFEYIYDNNLDGIIYNADDDNMYDGRLFNEIKKTINFGIFPVGNLATRDGLTERPILDKNGKFIRWNSFWQRKFSVDMAGFCFNVRMLDKLEKPFWNQKGYAGETEFIGRLLKSPQDMEFLCNMCRETYVWHNQLLHMPIEKIETLTINNKSNLNNIKNKSHKLFINKKHKAN